MKKPHFRDYPTDAGLHAAMNSYSSEVGKAGRLEIRLLFEDGSVYTESLPRETKDIRYKTRDGKTYTTPYSTGKFVCPVWGGPYSPTKMLERAVAWAGEGLVKASWEIVDD